MKDTTDHLLEALEHPEHYSDSELEELFNNQEMRDLYNLISKTSDSISEIETPDIDNEWNNFASKHYPKRSTNTRRMIPEYIRHHAAAALIGIIASIAVVAAGIGVGRSIGNSNQPVQTIQKTPDRSKSTTGIIEKPDSLKILDESTMETIIFRDESLETIISDLCRYYEVTATFYNSEAKKLHLYFKWDTASTLDEVVEQLNSFEQIKIIIDGNSLSIE